MNPGKGPKPYGLIVPNKDKGKLLAKPSIFNEDSDSDDGAARPTGLKRKLKLQDRLTQSKAVEEDATVYQYDEVYDEMDKKRKESKLSRKDLDKKPKYIGRLLVAAERRKKENERRIERQVQKEREAEGEEFKDKESFVTSAYRKKLEEMKDLEEQEKREEYLESIGDVTKQGNLDGFYRHLYDQKVNYEDKVEKENAEVKVEEEEQKEEDEVPETKPPSPQHQTKTKKYRKRKVSHSSDSEAEEAVSEVAAKKEHLPSNLDADSDFSIDSSDSDDDGAEKQKKEKPSASQEEPADEASSKPDIKKEDETNENETMKPPSSVTEAVKEEPVEIKVEPSEPKKPKIDIWKKRTVGEAFDAALQRYFERKALREL